MLTTLFHRGRGVVEKEICQQNGVAVTASVWRHWRAFKARTLCTLHSMQSVFRLWSALCAKSDTALGGYTLHRTACTSLASSVCHGKVSTFCVPFAIRLDICMKNTKFEEKSVSTYNNATPNGSTKRKIIIVIIMNNADLRMLSPSLSTLVCLYTGGPATGNILLFKLCREKCEFCNYHSIFHAHTNIKHFPHTHGDVYDVRPLCIQVDVYVVVMYMMTSASTQCIVMR